MPGPSRLFVNVDVFETRVALSEEGKVTEFHIERTAERSIENAVYLGRVQRVLPGMLAREHGHIVNIGSIAGYVGVPTEAVYSATKYAVQGFSDGLRRELRGRGVAVTLIAPGPIKTEFIAREKTGRPAPDPGAMDHGLPVHTVSRAVLRALTRRLPGYRTITVPRIGGWSRLGSVPGMARLTDLATRGRVRDARHERDG